MRTIPAQRMTDPRLDRDLDDLAARVLDWADAALSLGESHFPTEVRRELQDLIEEFSALLDDIEGANVRELQADAISRVFASAEMAEVIDQFSRIEHMIEEELGRRAVELIGAESPHFDLESLPREDDPEDED